jgi:hypothetical protein
VRGRRASIRRLFEAGFNVVQISKKVAASRWTVTTDLETIGLARFSDISDFELDELVAGEYLASHLALGSLALEARLLLTLGYHIPRPRLRKSRARLGVVHLPFSTSGTSMMTRTSRPLIIETFDGTTAEVHLEAGEMPFYEVRPELNTLSTPFHRTGRHWSSHV